MRADLHIHSTISDGSDTIEQITEMAKKQGLDAIAITDHDTMAHIPLIPQVTGLLVIGGVEISAAYRATNTRTHILGYGIRRPEIITALTTSQLEARNHNSERQATILMRLGYKIDMDQLSRADGKYLYKQHIMDWLVTTKQAPDMFGSFYQKIFKNGGVCAFDIDYIDTPEAISAIKAAGGLAVLAHPGQQKNFGLIPKLVELGLDGLELNHHTHCPEDRETIREYARQYGLFLTGGSDHHGKYEPQPFGVGDFLSDESGAKTICHL